jgi:hypothetical protein
MVSLGVWKAPSLERNGQVQGTDPKMDGHLRAHSTYYHDSEGRRWTVKKSPWGGPDEVDEYE